MPPILEYVCLTLIVEATLQARQSAISSRIEDSDRLFLSQFPESCTSDILSEAHMQGTTERERERWAINPVSPIHSSVGLAASFYLSPFLAQVVLEGMLCC